MIYTKAAKIQFFKDYKSGKLTRLIHNCLSIDIRIYNKINYSANFVFSFIFKTKSPKSGFVMKFKFTILLMACFVFSKAQNVNCEFRAHIAYPGQTLANICGYVKDGREYALLGGAQFTIIVDVTEPDAPVQIAQVPIINDLWKEIKTYQHYAYVTTEGGGGLQIIDLDGLPGSTLAYHNYVGDGAISGQLSSIHALHIDTTKGFCYLYGSNIGQGGAVILDLNADPYNPVYAGSYQNQGYIHDGYVDNDTLFAGHIYAGTFEIVNCANKANPATIATQGTPGAFTHNTWPTRDKKYILTTDEVSSSFLTCYDISDPNNIVETDRIQSNPGSNSIVHNTHVRDEHYAITSWYRDGFTIVDITRPHNLVQVGNYDTYTGSGDGFDGAWGVYPFFPSGTMVVSNIDEGLYVISPTFVRACYLEGNTLNGGCGGALNNVDITIAGGDAGFASTSKSDGSFATGQVTPGNFDVTFSKAGFVSQTINVSLVNGEVTTLNVTMVPVAGATTVDIAGSVVNSETGSPIANTHIIMVGNTDSYQAMTDATGSFNFDCISSGNYNIYAGAWGYRDTLISVAVSANNNTPQVALQAGYKDDFVVDEGWNGSGNATTGLWEREVPVGTVYQGAACNPNLDINGDLGNLCYMTGNGTTEVSGDDVDGGNAVLTSPTMDLSGYIDPILSYYTWFRNGGGSGTPNDHFIISINNGATTVVLEDITASAGNWRPQSVFHVAGLIPLTNNMHLICEAADTPAGNLVEAALDAFLVVEGDTTVAVGVTNILDPHFKISPNPFSAAVTLQYDLSQVSGNVICYMTDALGRNVETKLLVGASGSVELGNNLGSGVYFIRLVAGGKAVYEDKVVKL